MICEYVVPEAIEARNHEQAVFDIKEKGRNLWTGSELSSLISSAWNINGDYSRIELDFGILRQYSVKDWMSHSGLPETSQEEILELYLKASGKVTRVMKMKHTGDGDALVDRPFPPQGLLGGSSETTLKHHSLHDSGINIWLSL